MIFSVLLLGTATADGLPQEPPHRARPVSAAAMPCLRTKSLVAINRRVAIAPGRP
jgi:hypothetical protein